MAARYDNTIDLRFGGLHFLKPPRGKQETTWGKVRQQMPSLNGARICTDLAGSLQVELERTMGTPQKRVALIREAARRFSAPVQKLVSRSSQREVSYWIATKVDGVQIIVSTKVCECHDGLAEVRRWS